MRWMTWRVISVRPYMWGDYDRASRCPSAGGAPTVGQCRFTVSKSVLKPPGVKRLKLK